LCFGADVPRQFPVVVVVVVVVVIVIVIVVVVVFRLIIVLSEIKIKKKNNKTTNKPHGNYLTIPITKTTPTTPPTTTGNCLGTSAPKHKAVDICRFTTTSASRLMDA
jgi:Na+-transporting NADH:ubiquinone oxidoreductase subunit NqrF